MTTKKYSFYDTFVKTCEFKNGKGDCTKTRESKKCIDNHCKIVKIPMKKTEILNNYYQNYANDIQVGSGKQNDTFKQDDTFKCPYCQKILPVKNLIKHIKTHTNIDASNAFNQTLDNITPINQSFDELFPQFGGCDSCMNNNMIGGNGCDSCMIGGSNNMIGGNGCDSCMIGGAIYKKKYRCPLCKDYFYISHMKEHYIKYHK
jgi:hypothetical protein